MADLEHILQQLHDSEINAGVQTFYDAGMRVWIGDEANGLHAETVINRTAADLKWPEGLSAASYTRPRCASSLIAPMPKNTPVKRVARQLPSPHPIDVHVGLRIRQHRILLGMTQETLGAAIGLSFQQVQKYEIGVDSIPASRLVEVAKALEVPPSFFFKGPRARARDPLYKRETLELVRAYLAIQNPTVRGSIAETTPRSAGPSKA